MNLHPPQLAAIVSALSLGLLLQGCSIQRLAVDRMGDALAAGGTAFSADDDPELVAAAVPFSLKLMESLLAESPQHRGLLGAAAAGFTQYSYAFVQQQAEALALEDVARAAAASDRARRLYLRARDYGLRGLDVERPGFTAQLALAPASAVARASRSDVDLLYWTAASWAAAIGLGKDDPDLVADLSIVSALIDRALELDEGWDRGSLHSFLVTWDMARPEVAGERVPQARAHFERALTLSDGLSAAAWVSWAEAVCLPRQDLPCFEHSLQAALAIDPDRHPPSRLANTIMQRRARWLLANAERWILPPLTDADDDTEGERP